MASPAAPPVILTVAPATIPLNEPQQVITVIAAGIQNGFSVSILTEAGALLATLSGTAQLTYAPNSSTFSFQTNVFTAAGAYILRIQNPPGVDRHFHSQRELCANRSVAAAEPPSSRATLSNAG